MTPIGSQGIVHAHRTSCATTYNCIPGTSRTTRKRVAIAAKFRNRPLEIRRAIENSTALALQLNLSETEHRVLVTIIATCADRESGVQEMFAKKATLAKNAECSEATFYRCYAQLRTLGLLTTNKQQRHRDGSMAITTFSFSPWVCEQLGLPVPPVQLEGTNEDDLLNNTIDGEPSDVAEEPNERSPHRVSSNSTESVVHETETENQASVDQPPITPFPLRVKTDMRVGVTADMRVGPIEGDHVFHQTFFQNRQSFGKQSAGGNRTAIAPAFVKRFGRTIPADLSDLVDKHGIHPTGILALMGISKRAGGHSLSAIYAVVHRNMDAKNLTGRARYIYLRKCATDTTRDWTFVANQEAAAVEKEVRRLAANHDARALVGKWFRAVPSGNIWLGRLRSDCSVAMECQTDRRTIVLNTEVTVQVLADIEAGRLVEITVDADLAR